MIELLNVYNLVEPRFVSRDDVIEGRHVNSCGVEYN